MKCRLRLVISILMVVMLNACTVTTFGIDPKKIDVGKYQFTLYYNEDASIPLIDRKASELTDKIRREEKFSVCSYNRSDMVSASRIKEIIVNVTCE